MNFEFSSVAYRKPVRTLFNNIQSAVKFELQCGYISNPCGLFSNRTAANQFIVSNLDEDVPNSIL